MATREGTFVEHARRAQLIGVTIESVAEHGYAKVSLARIAEAAGITKAAVLYHFRTKDAVIEAAYEYVLGKLVDDVASAVAAADVHDGPAAYIRALVGHLHEHPRHTRVLIEARSSTALAHASEQRWGPLAEIIDKAIDVRGFGGIDARTLAIISGGAIDAIVVEQLRDPDYASDQAAEALVSMVNAAMS